MNDKTESINDILLTRPEHYRAFERHWENLTEKDKEAFDPTVVRVVELLNTHPSITTVMSCEGHFSKPPKMPNAWINMVVKDRTGVDFLQTLYSVLAEEVIERCNVSERDTVLGCSTTIKPNNFSLTIRQQAVPNYIPGYEDGLTWYRAFRLAAVLPPKDKYLESEKHWFFNRLEEYLVDNLPAQ